jgi:hypothetical protein
MTLHPGLQAAIDAGDAARVPLPRMRPWVAHLLTVAQLDEALDGAALPLWSTRGGDCPLEESDVPLRGHAWARRQGVHVPDRCLAVGDLTDLGPRAMERLLIELAAVAPDAMRAMSRRGLIYVEPVQGGAVTYLLGIGVAA